MTMAAAAKFVLDIGAMHEDFFTDTALIGISSALPLYRFCWLLNTYFGLNFTREPEMDVKVPGKKNNPDLYFAVYQYVCPTGPYTDILYGLKANDKTLLPEVKQLDYLWMLRSASPQKDAATYINYLRTMPDVQLASVLQPAQLKNVNNLLV
jgi:hypothetical protein